jgi:hypothetical protein
MGQRKTDREALDEALAQQQAGTYVDPVQGAKAFLSKNDLVADQSRRFVEGDTAAAGAQAKAAEGSRVMPVVRHALDMAAIPGAILPSPVEPAAMAYLAARGLGEAAENPSTGNLAMAGLGLLPYAKPVSRLVKAASEAKAIKGVRATYGAGDMGAAFGREVPYRGPTGVDTPSYTPSAFRKAMDGPAPEMSVVEPSAGVPQSKGTMSEVDSFLESLGLGGKQAQAKGQTAEQFKRLGSFDPHQSPQNFAHTGDDRDGAHAGIQSGGAGGGRCAGANQDAAGSKPRPCAG